MVPTKPDMFDVLVWGLCAVTLNIHSARPHQIRHRIGISIKTTLQRAVNKNAILIRPIRQLNVIIFCLFILFAMRKHQNIYGTCLAASICLLFRTCKRALSLSPDNVFMHRN